MFDDDAVSNLWEKLSSAELSWVKANPKLAQSLLAKYANDRPPRSSTDPSREYFTKVSRYFDSSRVSDGLKRLSYFIDDLKSDAIEFKSCSAARKHRERGNQLFKSGHYEASASSYRNGLLYAPVDDKSGEAALLHGNLSAVFFKQGLWLASLWECLVALEFHSSRVEKDAGKVVARLRNRLNACLEHLELSPPSNSPDQIKMFVFFDSPPMGVESLKSNHVPLPRYGFQDEFPGLSTQLKVQYSEGKGRHVIASSSFDLGDVVAVEPANGWSSEHQVEFTAECLSILPSQGKFICSACSAPLTAVGYVCPRCCAAAYCAPPSECFRRHWSDSRQCYVQPWWHEHECRYLSLLNSIGTFAGLCFRLALLRRRSRTNTSPIDDLVDHFDEFPPEELFEYALIGWLLAQLLITSQATSPERSLFDEGLWCFNTMRRIQCNAIALTSVQEYFIPNQRTPNQAGWTILSQRRVSIACFPSVSMFNHSCDSQLVSSYEGNFIIVRCNKPISANEEVCYCYGPHYLHEPSSKVRRAQLREQYFFECDCSRCTQPPCDFSLEPRLEAQWDFSVQNFFSACDERCSSFTEIYRRWTACTSIGWSSNCSQCTRHWWPQDYTSGLLWHFLGVRCLTDSTTELKPIGLYCLAYSVHCVYCHFGEFSWEYLWELVNFARVALREFPIWPTLCYEVDASIMRAVVPVTLDKLKQRIAEVAEVLCGRPNAERLMRKWLDPLYFVNRAQS